MNVLHAAYSVILIQKFASKFWFGFVPWGNYRELTVQKSAFSSKSCIIGEVTVLKANYALAYRRMIFF